MDGYSVLIAFSNDRVPIKDPDNNSIPISAIEVEYREPTKDLFLKFTDQGDKSINKKASTSKGKIVHLYLQYWKWVDGEPTFPSTILLGTAKLKSFWEGRLRLQSIQENDPRLFTMEDIYKK